MSTKPPIREPEYKILMVEDNPVEGIYFHDALEHAFRIAKSDLEARPIYHHKENSIKNHILLCFASLSISVFLELKTRLSIRHIVKVLKTITDAKIQNKITGEILVNRKILSKEAEELIKMSY